VMVLDFIGSDFDRMCTTAAGRALVIVAGGRE
jgi:hypothetical protein